MSKAAHGYRLYWSTWFFLLLLTLGMLLASFLSWPPWILLTLLLGAMLAKAGFIAGNFMHLRFERPALVLMVVLGILATSAVLFTLLVVDAARIHRLSGL